MPRRTDTRIAHSGNQAIAFIDGDWVDPATHQVVGLGSDGAVKIVPLRRSVASRRKTAVVVNDVLRRRQIIGRDS